MNEESQNVQLLLSILAYSNGQWSIDDVVTFYEFVLQEMQEVDKPDLRIVPLGHQNDD